MNIIRTTRRFLADLKHHDNRRMTRRVKRGLKLIRREYSSAAI